MPRSARTHRCDAKHWVLAAPLQLASSFLRWAASRPSPGWHSAETTYRSSTLREPPNNSDVIPSAARDLLFSQGELILAVLGMTQNKSCPAAVLWSSLLGYPQLQTACIAGGRGAPSP